MNKFDKVLKDIRDGLPVVIVDDSEREFEGDITLSAETCTSESLLLSMQAGGLMCTPCSPDIVENQFRLPMMVEESNDYLQTPFSLLCDSIKCGSGVSLKDRMKTIRTLADPNSVPEDLRKPGHIAVLKGFPLTSRNGHTNSCVDILKAAKLRQVGVIVEIVDFQTGEMARGPILERYCYLNNIKLISIEEIYKEMYG